MFANIFTTARGKLIGTAVLLLGVVGLAVAGRAIISQDGSAATSNPAIATVSLASVGELSAEDDQLNVIGDVVAADAVTLRSQVQGQVESLRVHEGQQVTAGQVVAELANDSQEASLAQARSGVMAQRSRLSELEQNAGVGTTGSTLQSTISQQRQLVDNAYRSLLNTDLQAYPENPNKRSGPAPTISGYYSSGEEGEYIVEVYDSSGRYGASFEVSGLEENIRGQVNTEAPVPLGTRGLYIEFPDDFDTNQTWVVPIPNTKSTQYAAALNAYESARESAETTITQARTNSDQLATQRAQVSQAEGSVASARAALEKTIIRAPISGVITDLSIETGDVISPAGAIGAISGGGGREIHTALAPAEVSRLSVGNRAYVRGEEIGTVSYISPNITDATKKREVHITLSDESRFVLGDSVHLTLERTQSGNQASQASLRIPLSALKMTPEGAQVLVVDASGVARARTITTGPLVGERVIVRGGISSTTEIITDARGIEVGQSVQVTNN